MRDVSLVAKAVRERWPVNAQHRHNVLDLVTDILDNPEASLKDKIRASKLIIDADKINLVEQANRIRTMPKHVIHTNVSTEELITQVQGKLKELGLDELPQEALPYLQRRIEAGEIISGQ